MSWESLSRLGIQVRPLERPELVPGDGNRHAPFRAKFGQTIKLLSRELYALDASNVVLQADFRDRDLRIDGMPRATARLGNPGVILACDSKFGPLQYPCSEFYDWQDNLRAIALSLEALRKVDRYGVSKRGEQYTGWRQIPQKTGAPADAISTPEDARRFLDEHGGSFIEAAKKHHPDNGGDAELFRAAVRARELLGGAA